MYHVLQVDRVPKHVGFASQRLSGGGGLQDRDERGGPFYAGEVEEGLVARARRDDVA
tara:strand:+ start:498 stop:668 length:171 start_codon:yes stop_codon:yes gene_type:complete